jgi:hypothetical protein
MRGRIADQAYLTSYFPSQNGEVKVGPVNRQVRGVERKR